MSMSNETKQTIIVNRDGQLDENWLAQLEAEDRKRAIQHVKDNMLNKLRNLPNRLGEIASNGYVLLQENRL